LEQTSLRKLSYDDFETIYAWENNEELWAVSDETGPFSRELIQAFIDRCLYALPIETERWIIVKEHDISIGAIDLFDIDDVLHTASIGIFIAAKEDRSNGHATRALRELIALLARRKWSFVKALIHLDNLSSIRLFKSAGFSPGEEHIHKGKKAQHYVYCLPLHNSKSL